MSMLPDFLELLWSFFPCGVLPFMCTVGFRDFDAMQSVTSMPCLIMKVVVATEDELEEVNPTSWK